MKDYPLLVDEAFGLISSDGKPMVCGGVNRDTYQPTSSCFVYDRASDSWNPGPSMLSERRAGAVVKLEDGRQWILTIDSSEIYANGSFSPGVYLKVCIEHDRRKEV